MSNNNKKVKRKKNGRFSVIEIIEQTAEDGSKVNVRGDESEMTKEDAEGMVETYKEHLSHWKKVLNKMNDIEAEEALAEV